MRIPVNRFNLRFFKVWNKIIINILLGMQFYKYMMNLSYGLWEINGKKLISCHKMMFKLQVFLHQKKKKFFFHQEDFLTCEKYFHHKHYLFFMVPILPSEIRICFFDPLLSKISTIVVANITWLCKKTWKFWVSEYDVSLVESVIIIDSWSCECVIFRFLMQRRVVLQMTFFAISASAFRVSMPYG